MKSLKLDTRNWDNMTDMEVLYDYTKCVAVNLPIRYERKH